MTKELVEEVARAIEGSQTKWIGVDPGSPLFCKSLATALLPILARQRNEGIEAAAKVADTLANLVIEADRIGALDRKHGYCADTARHIADLARNLKEPE